MGDPAFDSGNFDNVTFDRLIRDTCRFRGYSYDIRSDIAHPLIERFAQFLDLNLYLEGHTKLVMLIQNRIGNSIQMQECPHPFWERTKAAIVSYAAAMGNGGDHALLKRALGFHNTSVSPNYLALVQEAALLALGIWANNGDTDAIAILKSPPSGFMFDRGSTAQLRRRLLRGLSKMGDNAKNTGEARDEINRLLNEKDNGLDKAVDIEKDWVDVKITNIPAGQVPAACASAVGLSQTLSLAFMEAVKIKDTLFMAANNLTSISIAPSGTLVARSETFELRLGRNDGKWWIYAKTEKPGYQP